MDKIDVSVIVPVYNCEKYISRCIDSILNQENISLEIIIIDDGSKDGSLNVCKKYEQTYKNIYVIASENNGPAAARNKGIVAARGKYLTFVDSDDYISQGMYSKMFSLACRSCADVAVCGFMKTSANEKSVLYLSKLLEPNKVYKDKEITNVLLKSYYNGIDIVIPSLCNKLYRTKILKENKLLIDENYVRAEDYWFNFEVFKLVKSVVYVNEPYYNYRNNENSVMHTYRENQFEQSTKTHERLLEYNKTFKFEIDKNKFYKSYLYETAIIIKNIHGMHLSKKEKYIRLKSIVENNTYQDAINYTACLPKHIQLLSKIAKFKSIMLLDMFYGIWSHLS